LILWLLLAGHALCDYPLQGDFLARGKNHRQPLPGVPWYQCLVAHALIHGGAVALITGSVGLGIAETVAHGVIDYGKSEGGYGFNTDQCLHVLCKLAWLWLFCLVPRA
jgi:hypothetical protein